MTDLILIAKALDFAAQKHRHQRRKDHAATPYINHPIKLMSILIEEAGVYEAEVIAAALLHDTIEDTDTSADEIERHFGRKVRTIVEEVTDDHGLPRHQRKALQISHAPHLTREAALVKIADKIANLRDLEVAPPSHWTEERKQDYRDWAQKVISNIQNPHPQLLSIFQSVVQKPSEEV